MYVFSTLLLVSIAYSDSEIQTDWSGGGGVPGPVDSWGTFFSTSVDIDFSDVPGSILLNEESSILDPPVEHTVDGDFDGACSVFSADIDGDGDMDVLGACSAGDDITWWENVGGGGTSWIEHTVDGDFDWAASVFSADIDGDGDMDVLGAAADAYDITWWENNDGTGTTWTKHVVDDYFISAWSVYSADIDGDGDLDVLGASAWGGDRITWWENIGGSGTNWLEHTVDDSVFIAISVFSSDIDGDGDMDVLGASYYHEYISWWENVDGSGNYWTEHTVDSWFASPKSVFSSDIDGDGDMDILGAGSHFDKITWWENVDGTGTNLIAHVLDSSGKAYSVVSFDIDGDGDMDVLADYYDITWWENTDGTGTAWTEHTVDGDFDGSRSVFSSDIDGDGYMDVLGAACYDDDITWWKVIDTITSGELESSILYIEEYPVWDMIDWTASTPAGTSVSFRVRSSDDYISMGEWSVIISAPVSLQGVLADGDNYVQYKAFLETEYPGTANPNLEDVTITWNSVSIGEETSGTVPVYALFWPAENPVHSTGFIGFSIPDMNHVSLELFDLTGRKIAVVLDSEVSSGVHQTVLPMLQPGVYFVRMVSGEFISVKRFMVVE